MEVASLLKLVATNVLFPLGNSEDLLRNIHGVAIVAELDGDEIGYLLGRVAKIRRGEGRGSRNAGGRPQGRGVRRLKGRLGRRAFGHLSPQNVSFTADSA